MTRPISYGHRIRGMMRAYETAPARTWAAARVPPIYDFGGGIYAVHCASVWRAVWIQLRVGPLSAAAGASSIHYGLLCERAVVCAPPGWCFSAAGARPVHGAGARRKIRDAGMDRPAAHARTG